MSVSCWDYSKKENNIVAILFVWGQNYPSVKPNKRSTSEEISKPLLLMNKGAKILNKVLSTWVEWHIAPDVQTRNMVFYSKNPHDATQNCDIRPIQ